MLFEYNLQETYIDSIDIEDIGNFALRASNDEDGYDYYFLAKTVMGKTDILKFGPLVQDLDIPDTEFTLEFRKKDFKETIIKKEINYLLTDKKKLISHVEIIPYDEALKVIPNYENTFIYGEL